MRASIVADSSRIHRLTALCARQIEPLRSAQRLLLVIRMLLRLFTGIALLLAAAAPAPADEIAEAQQLRRSGQILTATGGGLQLVGAGLLVGTVALPANCAFALGAPEEGPCAYGSTTRYDEAARGLLIGGIIVSVVGDVVAIVGGVEWGLGGRRVKRLRAPR